jgi:hypothetical protein
MGFTIAVYCQPVGATPQRRGSHGAASFEEAVALGDQLVANYHEVLNTEGYEVYCELIE